jgi:pyridoxal phosphate enzyme (YggS family)
MPVNLKNYKQLIKKLGTEITLVAVSKTKPSPEILELYKAGHRDFGENYVQELLEKSMQLPADIRWHFIGHLQANKVKKIAPIIHMVHGVDSTGLLKEINKQARKKDRVIDCLLQVHIADEETKFGFYETEIDELIQKWDELALQNIRVCGMMGMATLSEDNDKIRGEFKYLKKLFDKHKTFRGWQSSFKKLSIGMSSDYEIAIEEGGNMVRIGSLLFGERDKKPAGPEADA